MNKDQQTADTIEVEAKTVTPAAPEVKTTSPWVRAGMTILKTLGVCSVGVIGYKLGQASVHVQNNAQADAAPAVPQTTQEVISQ